MWFCFLDRFKELNLQPNQPQSVPSIRINRIVSIDICAYMSVKVISLKAPLTGLWDAELQTARSRVERKSFCLINAREREIETWGFQWRHRYMWHLWIIDRFLTHAFLGMWLDVMRSLSRDLLGHNNLQI